MNAASDPEAWAGHPFLFGLSEEHWKRLQAGARSFTAPAGEYLAREGQPSHAFYLVQAGRVGIGTHLGERGAAPLQTVGPGEVVGWSWLLPPFRWQFDARALETVHGLAFDSDWLREQCEQDHELGYHVLKQLLFVLAGRLTASRVQRLDIYR
jgi:CRP/FNR family transcriptional regulator, cyclic AMP receptor protein